MKESFEERASISEVAHRHDVVRRLLAVSRHKFAAAAEIRRRSGDLCRHRRTRALGAEAQRGNGTTPWFP